MTIWEAIDIVAKQVPFARDTIETALSTTLAETDNPGNDIFRFYESQPVHLEDGVVVSNIDLRIKRSGPHPGFLVLAVDGACIRLELVRRHYDNLRITGTPRGRSLDEQTYYTATLPWGDLSFGFAERNPDCLASVAFNPTT